jgi:hypothetical protein
MEYAVEMGSGAMIDIHKDWFKHSYSNGGDKQAHRQHFDCKRLLLFLTYFPCLDKMKTGLCDLHAVYLSY